MSGALAIRHDVSPIPLKRPTKPASPTSGEANVQSSGVAHDVLNGVLHDVERAERGAEAVSRHRHRGLGEIEKRISTADLWHLRSRERGDFIRE